MNTEYKDNNISSPLFRAVSEFFKKWEIALRAVPFVFLVLALKVLANNYSADFMQLNALFANIVAGTIFLIGILVSGVLADYKESEKIPSEITTSLRTLYDDTYTLSYQEKNKELVERFTDFQKTLRDSLMLWLYKKETTKQILDDISSMNRYFVDFEKNGVQANFIIKMKNEQNLLRKIVFRIDTIRDTQFVDSVYTILETTGFFLVFGLIFMNIQPFYEGLFLTGVVTFLVFYMFFLIHDLDNPFDYATKGETGVEISLKPLRDMTEFYSDNT